MTYLFVPGSRPERFAKALESGADRVIIDLEDAVSPEEKKQARSNVAAALEFGLSDQVLVRVNPLETKDFEDDMALLSGLRVSESALRGVVFPKAENPNALHDAGSSLPAGLEMIAMIESARGVDCVKEIIGISVISQLALGGIDLGVDLNSDASGPVMDYVYVQLVIASRLADKLPPIGSPPVLINEPAAIERDARRLRSLGVFGQLCIHPAQIEPIHAGFSPTAEEVAWAEKVVASRGGAAQVAGEMVDKPVRVRAELILSRAGRSRS
jgi:citrate lyase beta subunit